MRILGIETSCDETAAAVVENGTKLLSNVVYSQIDLHREFGGVVPEVAARSHIETILPVVAKALSHAKCEWKDIDAIGATYGPGLPGALLVGALSARTLAVAQSKPLYAVNHVEAHTYANWLIRPLPRFPLLSLTVSGGHTQLIWFKNHGQYQLLGQTLDDAVGEAFDKVARILGLAYPGGPAIAKAAQAGNPNKYQLPAAKLSNPLDFSFSGLKTAVLRLTQAIVNKDYGFPSHQLAPLLSPTQVADIAASFQYCAIETLVDKTWQAYKAHSPTSVVIAGGVAANQLLRQRLQERLPLRINYAPIELCTDNAAMIAALAYFQAKQGSPSDPLHLATVPSLSM
jgi:N6-L-threonylcarbamoyladenine synthase